MRKCSIRPLIIRWLSEHARGAVTKEARTKRQKYQLKYENISINWNEFLTSINCRVQQYLIDIVWHE